MRTYRADVKSVWSGAETLAVAAKNFREAWDKVRRIMRKRRRRYEILSLARTAVLDG